jgi:hypothetical protein
LSFCTSKAGKFEYPCLLSQLLRLRLYLYFCTSQASEVQIEVYPSLLSHCTPRAVQAAACAKRGEAGGAAELRFQPPPHHARTRAGASASSSRTHTPAARVCFCVSKRCVSICTFVPVKQVKCVPASAIKSCIGIICTFVPEKQQAKSSTCKRQQAGRRGAAWRSSEWNAVPAVPVAGSWCPKFCTSLTFLFLSKRSAAAAAAGVGSSSRTNVVPAAAPAATFKCDMQ